MFYAIFRQLAQKKGVSDYKVAKDTGIPNTLISKWKAGVRSPGARSLNILADYFGVSVEYLLGKTLVENYEGGEKVPVYGTIAAGIPMSAIEEIIDYEEIPSAMARSGEFFALQVKGDSMSPRMQSGDVVIIKKQSEFINGQICAVLVNGEDATLKKVQKKTDGLTLIPLNPNYQPMNFTSKQVEELPIVILGVVVELRAKF